MVSKECFRSGVKHAVISVELLPIAKKSLQELRQLYFKLKDKVFARDRMGFAYNTDALESILKEELGEDMVMSDCHFPR